jgi:hypothetical protein
MKNFDQNISTRCKRIKCQSTKVRDKKPPHFDFKFKSSLFTDKNKSLIEKLISQPISGDNSFSQSETEKKILKNKPLSSTKKANIKRSSNSQQCKQRLFKDKKKVSPKKVFKNKINKNKNKINSTFSYRSLELNRIKNSTITNCQIKSIKKRNFKITFHHSAEKRKILFNGINGKKIKTRNNSIKEKLNLKSSTRYLYKPKNMNGSVKNLKLINTRNYLKNNNLNGIITVNTINLRDRKSNIINVNNLKKLENRNKCKITVNQKYNNTMYCQY